MSLLSSQMKMGFLEWTLCQVKEAVEAQLDLEMSPSELTRRLGKIARRTEYLQKIAARAARSHKKRRRGELRELGIDLRRVITRRKKRIYLPVGVLR